MLSESTRSDGRNNTDTLASHRESVERVITVMNERLEMTLSLQEMADIAYVSPYHFSRVFRSTTGIPPSQFLYALRLKEAKRLLLTTEHSVTDICFGVGYNSLGTFTRRFTELVGLTPTKLRALHQLASILLSTFSNHYSDPINEKPHLYSLQGKINIPFPFAGLIFVGLFQSQIPQCQPVACTFLTRAGTYYMSTVPSRFYSLFTAAYSCALEPSYVGQAHRLLLLDNDQANTLVDLTLRPVRVTDPPILLAVPHLFAQRFEITVAARN